MLCIISQNTDPYFHIASEEYLLRSVEEECFMLWFSTPSVVVGKHQNILAEADFRFARTNNIDIIRRLSGGGAVYHDTGNLNFTFTRYGEPGKMIDFPKHTNPILNILQSLGVDVQLTERNDMVVAGKKISGNAEHVFKNKVLHHGTILFDANLGMLRHSLRPDANEYHGKAVQSKRSSVANIRSGLQIDISFEKFRDVLFDGIAAQFNGQKYDFSEKDLFGIQNLMDTKYKTWQWNFGYSPKYQLHRQFWFNEIEYTTEIGIEKGIIKAIELKTGDTSPDFAVEFRNLLINQELRFENIRNILSEATFLKNRSGSEIEDLTYVLF